MSNNFFVQMSLNHSTIHEDYTMHHEIAVVFVVALIVNCIPAWDFLDKEQLDILVEQICKYFSYRQQMVIALAFQFPS